MGSADRWINIPVGRGQVEVLAVLDPPDDWLGVAFRRPTPQHRVVADRYVGVRRRHAELVTEVCNVMKHLQHLVRDIKERSEIDPRMKTETCDRSPLHKPKSLYGI